MRRCVPSVANESGKEVCKRTVHFTAYVRNCHIFNKQSSIPLRLLHSVQGAQMPRIQQILREVGKKSTGRDDVMHGKCQHTSASELLQNILS